MRNFSVLTMESKKQRFSGFYTPIVAAICCAIYFGSLVYIVRVVEPLQLVFGSVHCSWIRAGWGLFVCEVAAAALWAWKDQALRPGALFVMFQLIFVLIPSAAYATCYGELNMLWAFGLAIFLWIFRLSVFGFAKGIVRIRVPWPKVGIILVGAWIIYGIYVLASAVSHGNYSLSILVKIDDLYEFRKNVFESSKSRELSSLSCLGYFVLPYLCFIWTYNLRPMRLLALAPIILLVYVVTGIKTYIAIIVLCCLIARLARRQTASATMVWCFALLLVVIIPYFGYSIGTGDIWPMALLHRALMTPGELHSVYLQHFDSSSSVPLYVLFPKQMGNGAGLSWAEEIQYSVFGGDVGAGQGANVGVFSSAYTMFGAAGLVMYTIALAACIGYLDRRWEAHEGRLRVYSSVPALFLLTNIDFTTVFLYFGLGFSIVFASDDRVLDKINHILCGRRFLERQKKLR